VGLQGGGGNQDRGFFTINISFKLWEQYCTLRVPNDKHIEKTIVRPAPNIPLFAELASSAINTI
jgi:hypothetical protein